MFKYYKLSKCIVKQNTSVYLGKLSSQSPRFSIRMDKCPSPHSVASVLPSLTSLAADRVTPRRASAQPIHTSPELPCVH